ncbi:hypothetical protein Tco_0853997 [Tanacetum coccineum]
MDEPEPHLAYDFFASGPLLGYAGNPNNNNGWIEVDVPLLGELGAEADEPMVSPLINEIVEPVVEMEGQVIALVIDMEENIAMLFGDDDFCDDDSDGFEDEEEVWEVNEEWLMAPHTTSDEGQSFTLLAHGFLVPPSVIEDLCTRVGNLEYGHKQLVKKVMASQMVQAVGILEQVGTQVEQGQQTVTQRDEVIFGLSQQVQALQAAMQQRDSQIQQLQTMVSEMSSCGSTLMQCILGMDSVLLIWKGDHQDLSSPIGCLF